MGFRCESKTSRLLFAIGLISTVVSSAAGQDNRHAFWITDFSLNVRVGGTVVCAQRSPSSFEPTVPRVCLFFDSTATTNHYNVPDTYASIELGRLHRVGVTEGVGYSMSVGGGRQGVRIGLNGRYRRWVNEHFNVDAGIGPVAMRAPVANYNDVVREQWILGAGFSTGLTFRDAVGATAGIDVIPVPHGPPYHGGFVGLKLSARAGLIAGIAAVAVSAFAWAIQSR